MLLTILAAFLTGLGTIPFSPGIRGGTAHYLEAGVSTLLLGGVVVCLVALPRAMRQGGTRIRNEAVHALPLSAETTVLGTYLGSACAVAVYFLLCGSVYLAAAGLWMEETGAVAETGNQILAVGYAFILVLVTAALVAALHSILPSAAAFMTALFLLVVGQLSIFFPPLVGLIVPPFDLLDPAEVFREDSGEGCRPAVPALVRGVASIGLYLWLAVVFRIKTDSGRTGGF